MSIQTTDMLICAERTRIAHMIEADLVPLMVRRALLVSLGSAPTIGPAPRPSLPASGTAKEIVLAALEGSPAGMPGPALNAAVTRTGLKAMTAYHAIYALRDQGRIAKDRTAGVWRMVPTPDACPETQARVDCPVVELLREAGPDGMAAPEIAAALGERGLGNAATVRALSTARLDGAAFRDAATGRWRLAPV